MRNIVKIIFVYQVPSFWITWESLYEKLIHDNRFHIKVFYIDGKHGDWAQMKDSENFLENKKIEFEEFSHDKVMKFRPDYMIYQTPYDRGHRPEDTWSYRYRKEGIKIIYIPYGIEISDTHESRALHFALPVVLNAFSIYVLSEQIKMEYVKFCPNKNAVRALGLPRFDTLRKKKTTEELLSEKIGNKKVILWKVHFPKVFIENGKHKEATPKLKEYIKFVDYIYRSKELFFIFMPHPKFVDKTIDVSLIDDAKRLLKKLQNLSNVYIETSAEYKTSLLRADAVIVDRSAVMVEAGGLDVPVLYMYNSEYEEPMTKSIEELLNSYYKGTSSMEMEKFCENVLNGIDEKREERYMTVKMCVPYQDGLCASRIADDLYSRVTERYTNIAVSHLPSNSRIIVMGTGKFCDLILDKYETRKDKSVEIILFIDNDNNKYGQYHGGILIADPNSIKKINYDYVVIASDIYYLEMRKQLVELGVKEENILNADQFIVLMKCE